MAIDADWRDAAWGERHGLYARIVENVDALDVERAGVREAARGGESRRRWRGSSDHARRARSDWPQLLEERAAMSGDARAVGVHAIAIAKFKNGKTNSDASPAEYTDRDGRQRQASRQRRNGRDDWPADCRLQRRESGERIRALSCFSALSDLRLARQRRRRIERPRAARRSSSCGSSDPRSRSPAFATLQRTEAVHHHRELVRLLRADRRLGAARMRAVRNAVGVMRDAAELDSLPAHELTRRVVQHLVGIDVAVVVRRRHGVRDRSRTDAGRTSRRRSRRPRTSGAPAAAGGCGRRSARSR